MNELRIRDIEPNLNEAVEGFEEKPDPAISIISSANKYC